MVRLVSLGRKIGFIGLGVMGKPMASNLVKAGYELVVYDIHSEPVNDLIRLGAVGGTSVSNVAEQTQIVILMLPDSPQVEQVMLGENGALAGAKPGTLIIDMSSIAPLVSRQVAERSKECGVRFIDAPVSGGEPRAVDGTLSIMVGGDEKDYQEALPLLKTMGSDVVLVGSVGSGNSAKLANQIMVALNIAAMAEALVLVTKAGVNPELVYQAVRGGLAGSNALDSKVPLVLERLFEPGFRLELHVKDLKNAMNTAHNVGVPLPLTSLILEIMQGLCSAGYGTQDHGAIIRFYEGLSKIEVRREE